MILVQDQYRQGNRKNIESELHLKQDTSKQLFSDPTEIWEVNNDWKFNFPKEIWGINCEEGLLTSENESDEEDENLFDESNDDAEQIPDSKNHGTLFWKKNMKNVRFEDADLNYDLDILEATSIENEGNCGYGEHRRSLSQESGKMNEHSRITHRGKWHTIDRYTDKKHERRPKSSPEKGTTHFDGGVERRHVSFGEYGDITDQRHRMKRREHRCGRPHGDFDNCGEMANRKSRLQFEYGDDFERVRHGDCCNYCSVDDLRKKIYLKPKPTHKHVYHVKDSLNDAIPKTYKKSYRDGRLLQEKPFDSFSYRASKDHHCQADEYHKHGKSKKKFLEAVKEQQEQYSDSAYPLPCSRLSSHTMPGETLGLEGRRSFEKLANSSRSDWLYWSEKNIGEKIIQPHRLHKLRSRRTRMNRLKNGWKKAFVQTVRDETRNERVGVLVMGPKGPEFYSKNQKKDSAMESFECKPLEGAKSFEVMTADCKNICLSSSEPNYAAIDLACPEDEGTVDEKLANFSKNVSQIVKTSEEKFYKALSNNEYREAEKNAGGFFRDTPEKVVEPEEDNEKDEASADKAKGKHPLFQKLPFEGLSPRVPKSMKKAERTVNEESKAVADALNKQAKEYKENQKEGGNAFEKCLKEKFPPAEINQEIAKENLSLWGMKLDETSENTKCFQNKDDKEEVDVKMASFTDLKGDKKVVGNESNVPENAATENKEANDEPFEAEEKRSENVATARTYQTSKRMTLATKWGNSPGENKLESQSRGKDIERNIISEVFRDLVENGCAISPEESENLRNLYSRVTSNPEVASNDAVSDISSEVINTVHESKENVSPPSTIEEAKIEKVRGGAKGDACFSDDKGRKKPNKKHCDKESEMFAGENQSKKTSKIKNHFDDRPFKKIQNKGKLKKITLEDRMKLLREALPSIAAEREAAHLKQLKRYIDRFIERVEASTSFEFHKRKQTRYRSKESISTDTSEVRVDARKILDIVSNPVETISSDVTINIAKKLTDALVQEKTSKGPRHAFRGPKNSDIETDDDRFHNGGATSGSDRWEESGPTYLKQLKKMRNEHLNNIVLEVKRLKDLLRFLDRCNRLTF